jgi:hypothetical protein
MWMYSYSNPGKLALSLFSTLKDNVMQTRYGSDAPRTMDFILRFVGDKCCYELARTWDLDRIVQ